MPKVLARARGVFSSVRPRFRFTEWTILLVSLGVAAIGASTLIALQRDADDARRAELLITRIGESASSLHDRAAQATQHTYDPALRSRIWSDRARLTDALKSLEPLDPGAERVAVLQKRAAHFIEGVDEALEYRAAGQREEAVREQRLDVLPSFAALQREIAAAADHYDAKATAAVRNTVVGSAAAFVFAALLVALVAIVFGRKRVARERAAVEERMVLVRLLESVSASTNAAATLDEALSSTLAEICAHTGWPLGHVYLLSDDGSGDLVSSGIWYGDESRDRFRSFFDATERLRLAPGEGLPGRVMKERRPVWITAVSAAGSGLPRTSFAREVGLRSAFAFPVLVKGEVVAVLEFFSEDLLDPDPSLLEATAHIGLQLGYLLQRKRAERELRSTERRYRVLVEQLPLVTYIDEPEGMGSSTYLSPQIEAMSGYSPEEWLADRELFRKLIHPDDRERVVGAILRASEKGEPVEQEYRIVHRDGRVRWWRDAAVVVENEQGPSYRQGYAVDITARKEAEERLHEAQERYRVLVEQLPLITYIDKADATCTSIYISPQVETILGYPRAAWADADFFPSILHPDDRKWVLAEHERAYGDLVGMTLEYRTIHRDGHVVWIRDQMNIVRDAAGQARYAQGYMLDITGRKESEERLLEAEKRYRTLVEQLPLATYIDALDETSSAIYMSPQIEAMLGYSPEEWVADKQLFPNLLHPDDHDRVMAEVARTQETGEPFNCEYRLIARDGHEVWIRDEDVTIRDENGQPVYAQGYMLDITARKRIEEALELSLERERAANEHLRELDRLKDEFIALVSHELRTPLTSIRGYLEFLLEDGETLDPEHARFLGVVERNAERLQHLVNDLLFVAQVDAGRLAIVHEDVDLPSIAADAVEAARVVSDAKGLELELEVESYETLTGDRARLAQLLDNLISNAIKFTPEGGRVGVRTWYDGTFAHVEIADSGIGIPEDERAQLFERFYRATSATEQAIPGTGLGLAIAKAIVDAHGGTITVESTVGTGTTFTITLPRAAGVNGHREAA